MKWKRTRPEPLSRPVEVHCHVLPGLDDGPAELGESLEMCRRFRAEGVTGIVATPHLFHPAFSVEVSAIRRGAAELQTACRKAGIDVRIYPGAEVRLTPELVDHVAGGRTVLLADRKYLLLELPEHAAPPIQDAVFQLGLRGMSVVLAHPERNQEIQRNPQLLQEMVAGGCFVQITAGSLAGDFGPAALKTAGALIEAGLVHAVSGDAHGDRRGYWPDFEACLEKLRDILEPSEILKLISTNPRSILKGSLIAPLNRYR